jgi:hypothetical protein
VPCSEEMLGYLEGFIENVERALPAIEREYL